MHMLSRVCTVAISNFLAHSITLGQLLVEDGIFIYGFN